MGYIGDADILKSEGLGVFIVSVVAIAFAKGGSHADNGVFFCNQNISGCFEGGDGDFYIFFAIDIIDVSFGSIVSVAASLNCSTGDIISYKAKRLAIFFIICPCSNTRFFICNN